MKTKADDILFTLSADKQLTPNVMDEAWTHAQKDAIVALSFRVCLSSEATQRFFMNNMDAEMEALFPDDLQYPATDTQIDFFLFDDKSGFFRRENVLCTGLPSFLGKLLSPQSNIVKAWMGDNTTLKNAQTEIASFILKMLGTDMKVCISPVDENFIKLFFAELISNAENENTWKSGFSLKNGNGLISPTDVIVSLEQAKLQ